MALTDRDGAFAGAGGAEPVRLSWAYADDAANDAQPRDREVDRAVARLFAARARQEAVRRNREGDFAAPAGSWTGPPGGSRAYAGDDPDLRSLLGHARERGARLRRPDGRGQPEVAPLRSANILRSRDGSGRLDQARLKAADPGRKPGPRRLIRGV